MFVLRLYDSAIEQVLWSSVGITSPDESKMGLG